MFRDQSLDDEKQTAFSRRFGPLEIAGKANPGVGTPFARQSNLDIATGAIIPPEDRRMIYQKGNYLWHTDSSFRAVPSLVLAAFGPHRAAGRREYRIRHNARRLRCAAGGHKEQLDGLVAEHSLVFSRGTVTRYGAMTAEMKAELPGAWQAMVRQTRSTDAGTSMPARMPRM